MKKVYFITIGILFLFILINFVSAGLDCEGCIYDSFEDDSGAVSENLNYTGYIILFDELSIVEKYAELEALANENYNSLNSIFDFNPITFLKRLFSIMPEDVDGNIEDYKENIKTDRENIKKKIRQKLNKKGFVQMTGNVAGSGINQENIQILDEWDFLLNGIALNINDNEAEEIKNIPGIKSVTPNFEITFNLDESVQMIQEGIKAGKLDINGNDCTVSGEGCLTGKDITIAIIDSGVDYTHPDLGGCFGVNCKVIGGYDFINNDNDPMDDFGHGTHCAGIAAGKGVLNGVAPDAKIYAYKVLDFEGKGSFARLITAVTRANDPDRNGDHSDHADVISLSLGAFCKDGYSKYCGPDDPVSRAIDNAAGYLGMVVVISAGNSGPNPYTIATPGAARKAITVGAIDKNNVIASFSSRGPVSNGSEIIKKPDVVAPGVSICSAEWDSAWSTKRCLDNKHIYLSGTSMAAPHVAGMAALLLQKDPGLTTDEIKNIIKTSSISLGYDVNTQGSGRIDIAKALKSMSKPESKIFNNEINSVTGNFNLVLQKKSGTSWTDSVIVANKQVTIPANGFIDLKTGKDNLGNQIFTGWNSMNVLGSGSSDYRAYASFDSGNGNIKEGYYEIKVG